MDAKKIALIIGNSEYLDPTLARLTAPGEDVTGLADVLKSPDVGSFDEVITLINESAPVVQRAIARLFAQKKPDDMLLLYFSGHGVRDDQGHLYLAVKDTERDLLSGTGIPAAFITDEMNRSRSRRQVLILDCCHSGAFAQGAKGATGESVGTASVFEGTGYGRVVLTATDATQFAWQGDQVIGDSENSLFTHYLIEGLKTGQGDRDCDGRITVDDLYDYVFEQVVTKTPKQTPGKWSYKQQGDIVLAQNPFLVRQAAVLPPEVEQAIADPQPWVREGVVQELARLLNGSHPGLTLAAQQALRKLARDDDPRVASASVQLLDAYDTHVRAQAEEHERERLVRQKLDAERAEEKAQQAGEQARRTVAAEQAVVALEPAASPGVQTKLLPRQMRGGAIVAVAAVLVLIAVKLLAGVIPAGGASATATAAPRATVAAAAIASQAPSATATSTSIPSQTALAGAALTRLPTAIASTPLPGLTPTQASAPLTPTAAAAAPTYALGDLLFSADFSDPASFFAKYRSWSNDNDRVKTYIENGEYHVLMTGRESYTYWMWLSEKYTDFALEADARYVEGPSDWMYSLIFRFKDDDFYAYTWRYNGYYVLNTKVGVKWAGNFPNWIASTAFKPAGTNRLRVICRGSSISAYVNDSYLGTYTDTTFSVGSVGFYVMGDPKAHFAFDNLKVWSLK